MDLCDKPQDFYSYQELIPWKLIPAWMNNAETDKWMNYFQTKILWERPLVRVFGKKYLVPRLTAFISNNGINYNYSGINHVGNGFPSWFLPLLFKVNDFTGANFNGCLLNFYRDGQDRMGWHSDNERVLDQVSPIASLSLGISRDFAFKNNQSGYKVNLKLNDGDLLVMYPPCQHEWKHSLPSRKGITSPRINLTFRKYN